MNNPTGKVVNIGDCPDFQNLEFDGEVSLDYPNIKYFVTATALDKNYKPYGGGLVASFENLKDASDCQDILNGISSKFDARVYRGDPTEGGVQIGKQGRVLEEVEDQRIRLETPVAA